MSKIEVSIVVRTKNEEKNIKKCLEGIFRQKINKSFEVIIVDSGSTDNTLKIASQFPCKIIKIPPEEFTYPHALNVGVTHSKGEYCVFISGDAFPANDQWLYFLLEPFVESDVAAVYGRQIPVRGVNPIEETELIIEFPDYKPKSHGASSANCAIRRDLLKKFPFIEKHNRLEKSNKLAAEDAIWKMLIESKGWKTAYNPKSIVFHTHPLGIKYLTKRYNEYYNMGYVVSYFGSGSFLSKTQEKTSLIERIPETLQNIKNEFLYLLNHKYYLYVPLYFIFRITMLFRTLYGYYVGKKDRKKQRKLHK